MKKSLLYAFLLLFGGLLVAAHPATPSYVGNPTTDEANFQKFIISHLNQRVHLKLSFGKEEMIGYKSGDADPFLTMKYSYFFDCLEKQQGLWTTRCKALNYNQATNSLSGYFIVTEPRAKTFRTNRMFNLKPVK